MWASVQCVISNTRGVFVTRVSFVINMYHGTTKWVERYNQAVSRFPRNEIKSEHLSTGTKYSELLFAIIWITRNWQHMTSPFCIMSYVYLTRWPSPYQNHWHICGSELLTCHWSYDVLPYSSAWYPAILSYCLEQVYWSVMSGH